MLEAQEEGAGIFKVLNRPIDIVSFSFDSVQPEREMRKGEEGQLTADVLMRS